MHLTAFTDYSLRVLIYLGLERDRLATLREIAGAYDISSNHLMKVVQHLGKLGYIETVRGRGGGLRLAGDPAEMNVGQLVRHVEKDFAVVECLRPDCAQLCAIAGGCRLKLVMEKAVQAFLDVLDEYTLADLLQNATRLRSLLEFQPASARRTS
jgi:Rrf2 family nitric oxide-sensitive transcriptional repressor